jgi:hypothetical protein
VSAALGGSAAGQVLRPCLCAFRRGGPQSPARRALALLAPLCPPPFPPPQSLKTAQAWQQAGTWGGPWALQRLPCRACWAVTGRNHRAPARPAAWPLQPTPGVPPLALQAVPTTGRAAPTARRPPATPALSITAGWTCASRWACCRRAVCGPLAARCARGAGRSASSQQHGGSAPARRLQRSRGAPPGAPRPAQSQAACADRAAAAVAPAGPERQPLPHQLCGQLHAAHQLRPGKCSAQCSAQCSAPVPVPLRPHPLVPRCWRPCPVQPPAAGPRTLLLGSRRPAPLPPLQMCNTGGMPRVAKSSTGQSALYCSTETVSYEVASASSSCYAASPPAPPRAPAPPIPICQAPAPVPAPMVLPTCTGAPPARHPHQPAAQASSPRPYTHTPLARALAGARAVAA